MGQSRMAYFEQEEKTVLVDILEWYIEENDLSDEELELYREQIKLLEESQQLEIDRIDTMKLRSEIMSDYGEELKHVFNEIEYPKSAIDFYNKRFDNINDELRANQF